MDFLLLCISIALIVFGLVGCILPVVPGPPLSYAAVLIIHFFTKYAEYSTTSLVILGILAIGIQILDYIVPALGTKKFGGSKYGSWGSIIGLIIGLVFVPAIGPFGIITILAGPFFGAFIGELIGGANNNVALKAAFGSFIGFLAGTFMKLMVSLTITVVYIYKFIF